MITKTASTLVASVITNTASTRAFVPVTAEAARALAASLRNFCCPRSQRITFRVPDSSAKPFGVPDPSSEIFVVPDSSA